MPPIVEGHPYLKLFCLFPCHRLDQMASLADTHNFKSSLQMFAVNLSYDIVPAGDIPAGITNALIRELQAIDSEQSIQGAARKLGVSYRYLWGQIEQWELKFGQKLVLREQGKPARLTPLGTKLLWAEKSVMARYSTQIEIIRSELTSAVVAACDPQADIVTISGCFDPWLSRLPTELLKAGIIADMQFSTSREGLISLSQGQCDITGFNFPRGSGPNSSAAKTFAPLLDIHTVALCHFASRTQGLAVAKDNPLALNTLVDVIQLNCRYAGRLPGTGTSVLLEELLKKENCSLSQLNSTIEQSHEAVALAVATGRADAGLCVADAAHKAGVTFIPLAVEDYFLAWRKDREPIALNRLLNVLESEHWKMSASAFAGVTGADCGKSIDPRDLFTGC